MSADAAPDPKAPGSLRPLNVHATALVLAGVGILVRGRARSGKSALALSVLRRAEALGLEAALVADDQVFLEAGEGRLEAVAPGTIAGLIEISGVGVLAERSVPRARLDLVVDLMEPDAIERMPAETTAEVSGVILRRIVLPARQAAFGADVLASVVRPGRAIGPG